MEVRNYVVRETESLGWLVELEGETIARRDDQRDAIAAATSAAREAAVRESMMCRVNIATAHGCFPLTAFGSKLEQQQKMMKRMRRNWVDAA